MAEQFLTKHIMQDRAITTFPNADKTQLTQFIDPYSGFGFKHIFGKIPYRDFLIKFLNGVFKGRKVIVDIEYRNTEYKGAGRDYRKTIFDLYCTGDKGETDGNSYQPGILQQNRLSFYRDAQV